MSDRMPASFDPVAQKEDAGVKPPPDVGYLGGGGG
jgi:hypothetical protein